MTQQPALHHRDGHRSARSPRAGGHLQSLQWRVSVVPAAAMAVLGAVVAAVLLNYTLSGMAVAVLLAVAGIAAAAVLIAAYYSAATVIRGFGDQMGALWQMSSRSREDLQRLVERIQRGERPALHEPEPPSAVAADSFSLLRGELFWQHQVAEHSVIKAAALTPAGQAEQQVEVFVNLARRMQSLVHREIQLLDDLEAQVEDPELLKGLFTVDHLATRMRRQSESLAVLGGAVSRRQWTRPVTMHESLRAAVAEVEHYSRVKVVPPVEGVLVGSAVSDVIHLVAELVENATKFSAPNTQVLLRAQSVTAGLAIEVEDRGLGMLPADRYRMNELLADPSLVNISELLRDGRIGLFVVSSLARRHGVKVELQSNIFGGTQAIVIVPRSLVETGRLGREAQAPPAAAAEPASTGALASAASPGPAALPVRTPAIANDPAPGLPGGGEYVVGEDEHQQAEAARATDPVGRTAWDPWRQRGPASLPADLPPTGDGSQQDAVAWQDGRPPLPIRQAQANLAPQLREAPAGRRDEPPADQIPGLMAAFQGGFSRAEEEDSTATDGQHKLAPGHFA